MTQPSLTLYHHPLSGNSHRVRLLLNLLELPHKLIEVDLLNGAQKAELFLAVNPRGQVPALLDDDHIITESNAILIYLAAKFDDGTWLPQDAERAAEVQFWLSRAAIDVANGPAAARLVTLFGAALDHDRAQELGHGFLAELDGTLASLNYLVAGRPTVADVAVYTYVAHAPEGGIPLDAYPHVTAWIARIEALPGFVPMQKSPLPVAA